MLCRVVLSCDPYFSLFFANVTTRPLHELSPEIVKAASLLTFPQTR